MSTETVMTHTPMIDIIERLREIEKSAHISNRVGWQRRARDVCSDAWEEITRLRAENFALSAGQCVNAAADAGGRPECSEISRLRAELAELRSGPTPAPGQCPKCGEYSMSARAMQGLYGHKVDLTKP